MADCWCQFCCVHNVYTFFSVCSFSHSVLDTFRLRMVKGFNISVLAQSRYQECSVCTVWWHTKVVSLMFHFTFISAFLGSCGWKCLLKARVSWQKRKLNKRTTHLWSKRGKKTVCLLLWCAVWQCFLNFTFCTLFITRAMTLGMLWLYMKIRVFTKNDD